MPLKEAVDDIITNLGEGRHIYLHGRNAEGVFSYYINQHLPPLILDTRFHDFSRGGYSNYPVIAIREEDIRLLKDPKIMGFAQKKPQIILISENGSPKPIIKNRNFYSMEARFYLQRDGTYDVDIGIADTMAGLFLDVFDAYGEEEQQPYFQASEIIMYPRSRSILEGILKSVFIQKFPRIQVIASREITNTPNKYEVRMYELAESIAQHLGIKAVKIEETTDRDPSWKGDYVIRESLERTQYLEKANVIVLDDVIMSGKTIESLRLAVVHAKGNYLRSIVLMDRSEEHVRDIYDALTNIQTFMELKERRNQQNGVFDIDRVIEEAMADLYLNVFDAFVNYREGIQQPYFQTSEIIEYSRSRPILEGLLLSVFQKFPNTDVIASRELIGASYQHKVRMYELAETIAQHLGMEAVKIEETTEKEKYVIDSDIEGKSVLVLDDVVMSGKTIAFLKRAVDRAHGEYNGAVVLMDRSEEHVRDIYALTNMQTFMELKERRDQQNGNRLSR